MKSNMSQFWCFFFENNNFRIIGITIVAITLIICVTVLWISLKKIKSSENHHQVNVKKAEEINKICYCKHCELIKKTVSEEKGVKGNDIQ